VWPRHARGLAHRRNHALCASTNGIARDTDGSPPAGRRDSGRSSGHDR
jgi:hypothetical protein